MRCTLFMVMGAVIGSFGLGCERTPQEAAAKTTHPATRSSTEQPPARQQAKHTAATTLKPQPGEYTALATPKREPRDLELVSAPVEASPAIDGMADDKVWLSATEVTTLDRSSQREIRIKSVHTKGEIFMLVTYPDAAPSESHKTWVWDPGEGIYKQGPDREDAFVFKWSRSGNQAHLSLFTDPRPHEADVWFWKARRTNPAGHADDKQQRLTTAPDRKARRIDTDNGGALYLFRSGDEGQSAYAEELVFEYEGDTVLRHASRRPEGSRADVRAKGRWSDGRWTIEFARKLDTGHDDDVAFEQGQRYLFGVSCYEMSFDQPEPEWTQPLYRTGDVFDRLLLTIR